MYDTSERTPKFDSERGREPVRAGEGHDRTTPRWTLQIPRLRIGQLCRCIPPSDTSPATLGIQALLAGLRPAALPY